jgi:catalase
MAHELPEHHEALGVREDIGVDFVDALHAQYGVFAGRRAIHARGVLVRGTFAANGIGARYSRAPHFKEGRYDVLARFSNGDGCPHAKDPEAFSLGFGVRFELPGGVTTDLLAIDNPTFITDDPETFLDFVRALIPEENGGVSLMRTGSFTIAHPLTMKAATDKQRAPIAAGFERQAWWTAHTFLLTNDSGDVVRARLRWEPVLGRRMVTRDDAKALPDQYLTEGIRARLAEGAVEFDLVLTLGLRTDPDSVFEAWPSGRPEHVIGRLSLDRVADDPEPVRFRPSAAIDGISYTDDPLLAARALTYDESYRRRAQAIREGVAE